MNTDARINDIADLPRGYSLWLTREGKYYWRLGTDRSAWIADKMHAIFAAYHHADLLTRQSQPRRQT